MEIDRNIVGMIIGLKITRGFITTLVTIQYYVPTRFFYKKVVDKKVVLDWPKPLESFSTNSKKLREFKIFLKLNQTLDTCMVRPLVM